MSEDIEVKRVTAKYTLKDFIKLPWDIYENDPNWTPPLIHEIKKKLNKKKHPFFKHSSVQFFVAYYKWGPVGRIAAIVDYNHINFHNEQAGFFGMFECLNNYNYAEKLLDEARDWLLRRGMKIMRGPMNLSMNDECGFLLEGFDSPPVFMMPYNPPYYLEFMDKYGMAKAKDLYAYLNEGIVQTPERLDKIAERARSKYNVKVRSMNMKRFRKEVVKIKHIYNKAWEKNWGFVPMTDPEMDYLAAGLKKIVRPELVVFAEIDDRPVGVSITVPNYNEALIHIDGHLHPINLAKLLIQSKRIKGLRSLIMGMLKEYRSTGIPVLLFMETAKAAKKLGYEWCETSWNLEDNHLINKIDETIGGRLYKKYRVYEMNIKN
jgi:GNAT superfamily N-acetyltransferase